MEKNIFVIGDACIDMHIVGAVNRISPEKPVPIIDVYKNGCVESLGAAANVAQQIVNAGCNCHLFYKRTGGNSNPYWTRLEDEMIQKVELHPLMFNGEGYKGPIIKQRIWAESQQICRIDYEDRTPPDNNTEEKWIRTILQSIDSLSPSAIIFSDYNKGCLTDVIIQHVTNYAKKKKIVTVLDPKRYSFYTIKNLTCIKPNVRELQSTNMTPEQVSAKLKNTYLLNTLGKDGMALYQNGEQIDLLPSMNKEKVVDVCGSGDIVTAFIALSLVCGETNIHGAILDASKAAAIGLKYKGSYSLSSKECEEILGKWADIKNTQKV